MIQERDENGFFEKVFTAHPLAHKNQIIELSKQHILYEFDLRLWCYPHKFGLLLPLLPIKFASMIQQLRLLIKKEKIDLIRATDPYLMALIAWILSRSTGIPFCVSIHCEYKLCFSLNAVTGFKKFLRFCSKWVPGFVLPRASLVLPIRNHLKASISKQVKDNKIRIIPHGIDFNFQPVQSLREMFDLPADKKIISFVGRFSEDNYISDILRVLEKLSLIRKDFILVMVGNGEMESDIHAWIKQHPHTNTAIRLLGFQSNHIGRSLRYISNISLCLMGGFSLIEAAAAASPLIAYDVEWHNELVENNITGFLIKEHHIEGVVEAINYLLDDPSKAVVMGNNAIKKSFAQHDIVKTSELKQRCYLEILQRASMENLRK